MNKVITTYPGQTIFDIALQEYGSMEGVEVLMADNFGELFPDESDIVITQEPINIPFYNLFQKIKPTSD
jgi:hypothetical protein